MNDPGQDKERPVPMRFILRKLLRVFISMVVLLLLAWGVVVLFSPNRTDYRQGQQNRDRPDEATNRAPAAPGTGFQPRSFIAGERAEYTLRFAKAPIGTCVFKVAPRASSPGAPWRFSLRLTAMGGTFAYEANATVDPSFTRTLGYQNTEVIPLRGRRTVRLVFDDANRTVRRHLNGRPQGALTNLPPICYDPLSMIYAFREMDFNTGQTVRWIVTDGKSQYNMSARVKRREEIRIGKQTFRAILVEPDLGNFRGVFNKGDGSKLQIWFSDDAYTLPLRLRFKSPIGEITADNTKYRRPAPPRAP
jgi:hypothetical protein